MIVSTTTVKHNKFRRDQRNKRYVTQGNRIRIRRDRGVIKKKGQGYQNSQEGKRQYKDKKGGVAQKKGRAILTLEIKWKGKDGQKGWKSH